MEAITEDLKCEAKQGRERPRSRKPVRLTSRPEPAGVFSMNICVGITWNQFDVPPAERPTQDTNG